MKKIKDVLDLLMSLVLVVLITDAIWSLEGYSTWSKHIFSAVYLLQVLIQPFPWYKK